MMEKELKHYGVLGMKWGIRRYQPYSMVPRKSGKGGKEYINNRQVSDKLKNVSYSNSGVRELVNFHINLANNAGKKSNKKYDKADRTKNVEKHNKLVEQGEVLAARAMNVDRSIRVLENLEEKELVDLGKQWAQSDFVEKIRIFDLISSKSIDPIYVPPTVLFNSLKNDIKNK